MFQLQNQLFFGMTSQPLPGQNILNEKNKDVTNHFKNKKFCREKYWARTIVTVMAVI